MNREVKERKKGREGDQLACSVERVVVVMGATGLRETLLNVCYGSCCSPGSKAVLGFTWLHCWTRLVEEVTSNDRFSSLRALHLPTRGFAHLHTTLNFSVAILGMALQGWKLGPTGPQ